jgi:hypothetical protein
MLHWTVLVLLLSRFPIAAAQKKRKKGIPCGNMCIRRDNLCRKDGGGSTAAPLPQTTAGAWVAHRQGQGVQPGELPGRRDARSEQGCVLRH